MTTEPNRRRPLRALIAGTGVSVGGVVASSFTSLPVAMAYPEALEPPVPLVPFVALFVSGFVGFVLVGLAYLLATGRGLAYIDLHVPTRRDWTYAIGGSVAILALVLGVGLLVELLDLPGASNVIVTFVEGNPELLLVLIPFVFLANAPAEEFLFRNVVQKRLYDAFSREWAIVIASLLFTVVHIPAFWVPDPAAMAVSLTVVFVGSCVFGYLYARTDNLVVPTIAHAAVNSVQFGLLYLYLRAGGEVPMAVAVLL